MYDGPHSSIIFVLEMIAFEDPIDKFEIARGFKSHLEAVAADRRLETFLQDFKTYYTYYALWYSNCNILI